MVILNSPPNGTSCTSKGLHSLRLGFEIRGFFALVPVDHSMRRIAPVPSPESPPGPISADNHHTQDLHLLTYLGQNPVVI